MKENKKVLKQFSQPIHCLLIIIFCSLFFVFSSCVGMAATAEEYFNLGMAFFDLGRFDEAERWLNRARAANRTYVASVYNLGRIAFEQRRFQEAAAQFESILRREPNNVIALRAAAYARIRTGDIETARRHYAKLLQLIPESADDGYNHALVLFAMELYDEAEEVLLRYPFALEESADMQLLLARSQGRQNKVEAIDAFAAWLENNTNPLARYEYAHLLEYHEFFARALEEFQTTLTELTPATTEPLQSDVRFAAARVMLIADGENHQWIAEMEGAVSDGFDDIDALERLIAGGRISETNSSNIRNIINDIRRAAEPEPEPEPQLPDGFEFDDPFQDADENGDLSDNLSEADPESSTE